MPAPVNFNFNYRMIFLDELLNWIKVCSMERPQLSLWEAAEEGNAGVLRQWFAYIKDKSLGPDYVNRKSVSSSGTPLYLACENKHMQCAYLLLEEGASPLVPTTFNRTPLHVACYHGITPIVVYMLQRYPDTISQIINLKDKNGNTPLHEAVSKCNYNLIFNYCITKLKN
jgi:ankyrin repeat protein